MEVKMPPLCPVCDQPIPLDGPFRVVISLERIGVVIHKDCPWLVEAA